ncbi:MAG: hypothetical protein NVS1B4_06540 [Gemmatimonadaceae bacterium]
MPVHLHYLIPSILLAVVFTGGWLFREKEPMQRLLQYGGGVAPVVVPRVLTVTTFLAGTILLFSGATPAVGDRLRFLDNLLPLPLVEVSHFFGSLAGISLLVLARGIQRRLDVAYVLSLILLAAGIVTSLLKAFDYEEATVLGMTLVALLPCRRYFYRRASFFEERFSPQWLLAIATVVTTSVILGLFSYGRAAGAGDLFWEFAFQDQAPRFVRATIGVVAVLLLIALGRLVRPARAERVEPTADDLGCARAAAVQSPRASAHLVALGDKQILFNAERTGFIMYGIAGRSWVSMGDPVASAEDAPALTAAFLALCDSHGGWPVFYQAGREQMYLYLDHGLSVVKIGEEARVPLPEFTLEGPSRRNLRRVWRKAIDDGCSFELVRPGAIEPLLPRLRGISEEWLDAKKAREKSFSLGFFDEAYAAGYPMGIVRRAGNIVAFANVWPSGAQEELQVDLMRYSADAPAAVMRYLLVELMLWGKAERFRWFNLGMAPLSGIQSSTIAPLWHQLGNAIYGFGERFYNFQGVRAFKDWFYPEWEPKYLVSPGGALRPLILANIVSLVSGGLPGAVRK